MLHHCKIFPKTLLIALMFVAGSCAFPFAVFAAPQPVPNADKQAAAEKSAQELFKDQLARREPAARIELAQKLLSLAKESDADPASQYVLFRQTREVAASAGDFALAFRAIDEAAAHFSIDVFETRRGALAAIAKAPSEVPAESFVAAAAAAMEMIEQATRTDHFDDAERLLSVTAALGKRSGSPEQIAATGVLGRQISDLRYEQKRANSWFEKLKTEPNDPEANLMAGRYLCFSKEDWAQGIAHLAKGSDASLRKAATADLSKPADAAAKKSAGDLWYDAIIKPRSQLTKPMVAAMQSRAAFWYWQALSELTGLDKPLVEKRLVELESKIPTPTVIWHVVRKPVNTDGNEWTFPDGGGEVASASPMPNQSFTLRFETNPAGDWGGCRFRISGPDAAKFDAAHTEVTLWAGHPTDITHRTQRLLFSKTPFPDDKKWHSIIARITAGRIIVLVDGEEFIEASSETIAPTGFLFFHGNRGKIRNVFVRTSGGE